MSTAPSLDEVSYSAEPHCFKKNHHKTELQFHLLLPRYIVVVFLAIPYMGGPGGYLTAITYLAGIWMDDWLWYTRGTALAGIQHYGYLSARWPGESFPSFSGQLYGGSEGKRV